MLDDPNKKSNLCARYIYVYSETLLLVLVYIMKRTIYVWDAPHFKFEQKKKKKKKIITKKKKNGDGVIKLG